MSETVKWSLGVARNETKVDSEGWNCCRSAITYPNGTVEYSEWMRIGKIYYPRCDTNTPTIKERIKRLFHLRAMMRAINLARGDYSKTYGLRVIRRFEYENGFDLDPFDDFHLSYIRDCGRFEWFFRRIELNKKALANKD